MRHHGQRFAAALMLAAVASVASGAIPEPDHIFYGNTTHQGVPITSGVVTVRLAGGAAPIASYVLDSEGLGSRYVLRVPIDSVEPPLAGTARPGMDVEFFVDGSLAGTATVGGRGEVQVLDLDQAFLVPTMTISDVVVLEGDGAAVQAVFVVSLSESSPDDVTVDFATADGPPGPTQAQAGLDYTATSGELLIEAGNLEGQIIVPVLGDFSTEQDETFVVNLTNPDGALLGDGQGVATIVDNERPPDLAIADAALLEGDTGQATMELTITLSRVLATNVTVSWATSEGTATSGLDFLVAGGVATVLAGSLETTVEVEILADVEDETDETFTVTLSSPSANATISDGTATATIWDDDGFLEYLQAASAPEGLDGVSAVAVAPGGGYVYAAGTVEDALVAFTRDPADGTLSFLDVAANGDGVTGLDGPEDIAVAGDGAFVYTVSHTSDSVAVFAVTPGTGELQFVQSLADGAGADGLDGATALALSPSGQHLYVVSDVEHALAVFARDAGTGMLTWLGVTRQGDVHPAGTVHGLQGAADVAVSADGKHVYVAAALDDAVGVFSRDTTTGVVQFVQSRVNGTGSISGLEGASAVAVPPDGGHVYAAGADGDAVLVFARNDQTGGLTWTATVRDDVAGVEGLDGATDLLVSADSRVVYAAGLFDDALAVFLRDTTTGALTFIEEHHDGGGGEDGLARPTALAASADDTSVYAAGRNDDMVAVFLRDALAPSDPPLGSFVTSHVPEQWSNVRVVQVSWSGAADNPGGSGLLGYSFLFDNQPLTLPDLVIDLAHGTDPHQTASAALPDGGDFRFHLRTCDRSANCTSTVHLGRFRIDGTPPPAPTGLASPSHGGGAPTDDDTITVLWTPPVDNLSGLAGYSATFDGEAANTCGESDDLGTVATVTSPPLGDGTWYFHLCARDLAGNWGAAATAGPFVVETAAPTVLLARSVAATEDGQLESDEVFDRFALTRLGLVFSEGMRDAVGDGDPDDVTNPANYRVVSAGPNGSLETTGCGGLGGDDVALGIQGVALTAGGDEIVLAMNGGVSLPAGSYALLACSTLEDEQGNLLDGNADGTGGDDHLLAFAVGGTNVIVNPNFDGGIAGWNRSPANDTVIFHDALLDADGHWASGSLRMASLAGTLETFVHQCVPAAGGDLYDLDGLVAIASGSEEWPAAQAVVQFYGTTNCSLGSIGSATGPAVVGDTAGLFESLALIGVQAPVGAQSARVFYRVDATDAGTYDTAFDDLAFGSTSLIFLDGFEDGTLDGWVVP